MSAFGIPVDLDELIATPLDSVNKANMRNSLLSLSFMKSFFNPKEYNISKIDKTISNTDVQRIIYPIDTIQPIGGFSKGESDWGDAVVVKFDCESGGETVAMSAPLLSLVQIPNLQATEVTIDFEAKITVTKDTESSGKILRGILGNSNSKTTSTTNGSYKFAVVAKQQPPTELLQKLGNVLANNLSAVPKTIS
jgi:hypothetical protein